MATPRIITARQIGLHFAQRYGQLGPELHVTGHYSATRRARDYREGIQRMKSFHAYHLSLGWGGTGYNFGIPDDGALICLRPTIMKGCHVAWHNSNNVGVVMPGTTGDRPTREQASTFYWLLANAHTSALPKAHRTDRDLRKARRWGHKQWPRQATACPGLFLNMYLGRDREFQDLRDEQRIAPEELMYGDFIEWATPTDLPEVATLRGVTADGLHLSEAEAEDLAMLPDAGENELPPADEEWEEQPLDFDPDELEPLPKVAVG